MKKLLQRKLELGLILALLGTQISCIIREFVVYDFKFDLTNTLFFISFLMIFNINCLSNLKITKPTKEFILVFIYNIYVILVLFLTRSFDFFKTEIFYTLYVIALLFAILTNNRKIDGNFFIRSMWYITSVCSILLFYLATKKLTTFTSTFIYLPNGSDRLTMSVIPFYNICSALIFIPKNKFEKYLKFIFTLISIYNFFLCSRRGLMVSLILILIYYLIKQTKVKFGKNTIKNIFKIALIFVILVAVFNFLFPSAIEMCLQYVNRFKSGVLTYFGNFNQGVDQAAINRNNVWNTIPKEFLSYDLFSTFFGKGYSYKWLDVPFLQAFTDMGLIGGIVYLVIQLYYPVKLLLKKSDQVFFQFAQYVGITTISYNIYSGQPYGFAKFVGLIIFIYAYYDSKKIEGTETLK